MLNFMNLSLLSRSGSFVYHLPTVLWPLGLCTFREGGDEVNDESFYRLLSAVSFSDVDFCHVISNLEIMQLDFDLIINTDDFFCSTLD